MSKELSHWLEFNRGRLLEAVAGVRRSVQEAALRPGGEADAPPKRPHSRKSPDEKEHPPAFDLLASQFGLSSFERDVMLLAAGMDLDPEMATACAAALGVAGRARPTVGLALETLEQPHWSAFSPEGPLRNWRLIELGAGEQLTERPVHIDERIFLYLTGVNGLDERLRGILLPLEESGAIEPSRRATAETIARLWLASPYPQSQAVVLAGRVRSARAEVASAVCRILDLPCYRLPGSLLPSAPADLEQLARLVSREAMLSPLVIALDCAGAEDWDTSRTALAQQFVDMAEAPLLVLIQARALSFARDSVRFEVQSLPREEQKKLWQESLPDQSWDDHAIERLTFQFVLERQTIRTAAAQAAAAEHASGTHAVWEACRAQSRPVLEDLAQRIEPRAAWDDLILPPAQKEILRSMLFHVEERATVYGDWGFGAGRPQGLGISALFEGPSGTGKTMAAEVLAGRLHLDLFRIDLSSVVSKYIGETEKNLRRLFDAAEGAGAILVFDEADALFGKRTEVKDSHDRYANIEVSYLLQRMESYGGLAILTTNHRQALDSAFLRRLRFIVSFPFPDAPHRTEIWRRVFPEKTPVDGLDYTRLGQLNASGGTIRNVALNAAFLAAAGKEPVRMVHIHSAAVREYRKQEKTLSALEIEGWVQ